MNEVEVGQPPRYSVLVEIEGGWWATVLSDRDYGYAQHVAKKMSATYRVRIRETRTIEKDVPVE